MVDRRKNRPPPSHPPLLPPPPPPPRAGRELTMGVEIELLVIRPVEKGGPKPSHDEIAAVLREKAGVAAVASETGHQPGDPPGQWRVTTDYSISPLSRKWPPDPSEVAYMRGRKWTGAELVSCIFHDNGTLDAPWSHEIRKVLQVLETHFEIRVNDSMGYHVHIGVGVVIIPGFSLEELHKLAVFVVIYEGQIDKLHADHRSTDEAIYCESNRKNDSFALRTDPQVVDMILETTDIPALIKLMCPGGSELDKSDTKGSPDPYRYYKVNFQSVHDHGTVEWRQCEGTIDPWKACRWPRLVSAITRKVIEMPMDEFLDRYNVQDPPDLLDDHPELRAAWEYRDVS